MAGEDDELHAAGRIPDTRRAVVGGRNDAARVGRERDAADGTLMAGESGDLPSCGRVQDARGVFFGDRCDDNALPIGRIGSVDNVLANIGQYGELHGAGHAPDVRRSVPGSGNDALPVG